jgi:CheY-like chemotaxis protein
MDSDPEVVHRCPYCHGALQWVPQHWFGRGTFECEQCGEFPDLTEISAGARSVPSLPADAPATRYRKPDGRPRVLLVDDSAEYRDLYALMLEPTATVITASRGEEVMAIASSQPIDAIVLDVMMPGMDGWQACEQLKANPRTTAIPVILLTSLDGLDVPQRAGEVGAEAVLIKPCGAERLTIAIDAAINRRLGGGRRRNL